MDKLRELEIDWLYNDLSVSALITSEGGFTTDPASRKLWTEKQIDKLLPLIRQCYKIKLPENPYSYIGQGMHKYRAFNLALQQVKELNYIE